MKAQIYKSLHHIAAYMKVRIDSDHNMAIPKKVQRLRKYLNSYEEGPPNPPACIYYSGKKMKIIKVGG